MYKYDYYSGAPVIEGAPEQMSQEEIVQNANLYDFNANARMSQMIQMQQQAQYPMGSVGYYSNPVPPNFMNPPIIGGSQESGFQGFVGNPAFSYMNAMGMQNPYMNQPQYQDQTIFIPGFNTGSRLLLPSDAEDLCDKLQTEMMMEQEEAYVQRVERQKNYYQNLGYTGSNYYGMPYAYSYYNDPTITAKYKKLIEDMKQEAIEARNNLNKNLSRLSRSFIYGECDETEIDQLYEGRYITIPATVVQYNAEQAALSKMQVVDSSYLYQQHHAKVSEKYKIHFDDNTDMNTFFEEIGQIIAEENLEEESHRRRDDSVLFDGNSYRTLLRKKLIERNRTEGTNKQINLPGLGGTSIPMGGAFPTLSQSSKLLDDGTLQITAPSWLGNKQYSIKNTMEDDYEVNRNKFLQSIYGNTPTPGNGGAK